MVASTRNSSPSNNKAASPKKALSPGRAKNDAKAAGKNSSSPPKLDLSKLGITIKKEKTRDNNSWLKLAVVTDEAFVFRCESREGPTVSSWSEKVFFDCVMLNKTWITELGIQQRVLHWYDENVEKKNNKGYGIRMFAMNVNDTGGVSREAMLQVGRHIADCVNAEPNNTAELIVEESTYFWKVETTWEEIIGEEDALKRFSYNVGANRGPSFFNDNRDVISRYFRLGSLSITVARALNAPATELAEPDRFGTEDEDSDNSSNISMNDEEEEDEDSEDDE